MRSKLEVKIQWNCSCSVGPFGLMHSYEFDNDIIHTLFLNLSTVDYHLISVYHSVHIIPCILLCYNTAYEALLGYI